MESGNRDTTWRQGDVVSAEDLCQLVSDIDRADQTIGVVISHDCDLASTTDKEPYVEDLSHGEISRLCS